MKCILRTIEKGKNCKMVQKAEITVREQSELKHLGVMIYDWHNFNTHVDYACEKAAKVITALSRIMPNDSEISSSKIRLLASVCTSILRYAGPVWVAAPKTKRNRVRLASKFKHASIECLPHHIVGDGMCHNRPDP